MDISSTALSLSSEVSMVIDGTRSSECLLKCEAVGHANQRLPSFRRNHAAVGFNAFTSTRAPIHDTRQPTRPPLNPQCDRQKIHKHEHRHEGGSGVRRFEKERRPSVAKGKQRLLPERDGKLTQCIERPFTIGSQAWSTASSPFDFRFHDRVHAGRT
jgi:hypothetical protein